jgi:hypothetical protein
VLDELKNRARHSPVPNAFLFTGFVPWESVIGLCAASQVFVTLSLSEVQPMTIIEAELCGLPIIARMDESLLGLVEDGVNGFLTDEDRLVPDRILELLRDPSKTERFSRESAAGSSSHSIDKTVALMECFYEETICQRSKPVGSRMRHGYRSPGEGSAVAGAHGSGPDHLPAALRGGPAALRTGATRPDAASLI